MQQEEKHEGKTATATGGSASTTAGSTEEANVKAKVKVNYIKANGEEKTKTKTKSNTNTNTNSSASASASSKDVKPKRKNRRMQNHGGPWNGSCLSSGGLDDIQSCAELIKNSWNFHTISSRKVRFESIPTSQIEPRVVVEVEVVEKTLEVEVGSNRASLIQEDEKNLVATNLPWPWWLLSNP